MHPSGERASGDRHVSDFMQPAPVCVDPCATADAAKRLATERGVHHLVVVEQGAVVGVVCLCDLGPASPFTSVARSMSRAVVFVESHEPAEEALVIMRNCGVHCLVVLDDDGFLQGVVTPHDLDSIEHPREPPALRCAACGSLESVSETACAGVAFCASCLEQVERSDAGEDLYFTLGGGG